jgi:acetyl-CoA carboxylase carboxyl transferase subunit alpha
MLENACYSVITPEGCASILWHRNRDEAPQAHVRQAAEVLQLTANDLKRFGIIEEIVKEPLGGAHRNHKESAEILRSALQKHIEELSNLSEEELCSTRYEKFRSIGMFTGDGK